MYLQKKKYSSMKAYIRQFILEYVHMRPEVKSNRSEFTSVRDVFSICVHMNFISPWVWVHFR